MIAQATGGTISVTGEKGRGPVKPGLSLGDTGTGMTMAITILGALHKRAETGEGHRLQVAMQDAMLHYMRTNFSTQARSGKAVERDGTHSGGGSNAPSGLYPCAPGGPNDYVWIMTSRANPEHWARLCKVMGREELISRSALRHTGGSREEHARAGCDHRGMDAERAPSMRRWRRSAARAFRRARCSTRWSCRTTELRATRHHAGDAASELQAVQDAGVAGAHGRQAAAGEAVADAGRAHGPVLTSWLGLSEAEVKSLHGEGIV